MLKNIYGRPAVLLLMVVSLLLVSSGKSEAQVPARPQPESLVNDLADIFSALQEQKMENALVAFADSTSNQIAVVTVPELYGMDKAQLAFQIGEQWGVGQKKFNNGVVILVKPKTDNSNGEVFIATGYGLEGVLTDAVCRRIIEQYMIPSFKANDYYSGVVKALNVIMPLAAGEISTDEFASQSEGDMGSIGAFIFLAFIVVVFLAMLASGGGKNGPTNMGGGNHKGPSAADLIMLGILSNAASGSRRSSGGWGGSSGGFGGGFGGGGFGGFGGGGFGGGGAGGSW